jgi:hypothetical protein
MPFSASRFDSVLGDVAQRLAVVFAKLGQLSVMVRWLPD